MFTTRHVYTSRAVADGRKSYLTLRLGSHSTYPFHLTPDRGTGGGDEVDMRVMMANLFVASAPHVTFVAPCCVTAANMEGICASLFLPGFLAFVAPRGGGGGGGGDAGWLETMFMTVGEMGFGRGSGGVGAFRSDGVVEVESGKYFLVECFGADAVRGEEEPVGGKGEKGKGEETGDTGEGGGGGAAERKEERKEDGNGIPANAPQFLKDLILNQKAKMYKM